MCQSGKKMLSSLDVAMTKQWAKLPELFVYRSSVTVQRVCKEWCIITGYKVRRQNFGWKKIIQDQKQVSRFVDENRLQART